VRVGRESSQVVALAGKLLGRGGRVEFRLHSGGVLIVSAGDRYWIRHALFDRAYESDVDVLVSRVLRDGDAFLDCGANIGLWSIAASEVITEPTRVLAVEASASTYEQLGTNRRANGERFAVLRSAIWDRDGEVVPLYSSLSDSESSSTVEEFAPSNATVESVVTVALLSLVESMRATTGGSAGGQPLTFVKLDVEGLEARLLGTLDPSVHGDLLVIYEDHGRDRTHSTTAAALARGFRVAFLAGGGRLKPITDDSLRELDELKPYPSLGYNFLAVAPNGSAARRLLDTYPDLALDPGRGQ
jgi:FkbM family methyltransferase